MAIARDRVVVVGREVHAREIGDRPELLGCGIEAEETSAPCREPHESIRKDNAHDLDRPCVIRGAPE